MTHRILSATAVVALSVALTAAYTDVTFVMKNGQRLSGTFSYNHTDHYQLIVNGQERSYPSDDIALIAFTPGDPAASELVKLPENDGGLPEHERHTIVLRSGEMLRGKIYDFQGDRILIDMQSGGRRTFNMGDVARLYISYNGARSVYASTLTAAATAGAATADAGRRGWRGGGETAINVDANRPWTDTGLLVNQGDRVSFAVSGEIRIDPQSPTGPDGHAVFARNRSFPVPEMNAGGLVGRIGTTTFPIGSNSNAIMMPATGRLYLGVNDDRYNDNSGAFAVRIRR